MKSLDSFTKWMFFVGPILFICGFIIQQHHLAQNAHGFAAWKAELLSQDWIKCEREKDHKQLNLNVFRLRLASAKPYRANHERTMEQGTIVIFTKSGEVPIHYEVFESMPETVVIYNDDFGFWIICKKTEIGF